MTSGRGRARAVITLKSSDGTPPVLRRPHRHIAGKGHRHQRAGNRAPRRPPDRKPGPEITVRFRSMPGKIENGPSSTTLRHRQPPAAAPSGPSSRSISTVVPRPLAQGIAAIVGGGQVPHSAASLRISGSRTLGSGDSSSKSKLSSRRARCPALSDEMRISSDVLGRLTEMPVEVFHPLAQPFHIAVQQPPVRAGSRPPVRASAHPSAPRAWCSASPCRWWATRSRRGPRSPRAPPRGSSRATRHRPLPRAGTSAPRPPSRPRGCSVSAIALICAAHRGAQAARRASASRAGVSARRSAS